jgi:hypothetical protein
MAAKMVDGEFADLVEKRLLYKSGETKSVKYLFSDAE